MLISLVIAARSMVIFPWFHRVPVILLILCGAFALPSGSGIGVRVLALLLACFTALLLYGLLLLTVPREMQQEFVSPLGKTHLIIEYDHASRPYLYLRHGIFLKSVNTAEFNGTPQVITYCVQWLSEDEVMLYQVNGPSVTYVPLN